MQTLIPVAGPLRRQTDYLRTLEKGAERKRYLDKLSHNRVKMIVESTLPVADKLLWAEAILTDTPGSHADRRRGMLTGAVNILASIPAPVLQPALKQQLNELFKAARNAGAIADRSGGSAQPTRGGDRVFVRRSVATCAC